jgi:hypothetical protein
MKPNMTLDDISNELLIDCASLVKANSIQGCKVSSLPSFVRIPTNLSRSNMYICSTEKYCVCRLYTVGKFKKDK